MKHSITNLLKKIGFNESWSTLDITLSLLKLSMMFLRGLPYYFLFRKIGGFIFVGKGVRIRNPRYISALGNLVVEDYAEIQGISKKGIKLGKNVTIGSFAMIRPSGYYGREVGEGLIIGDHSNIGAMNYIGCSGYVKIGNNVMISPRVSIYAENHNFSNVDIPMKAQGVTQAEVTIEDDCWIASNSVVLAGVKVKQGSVVAAGTIVTKDVQEYSIVGGVPAKVIRKRKT